MDAAITPHSPAGIRPLRRLPQKEKNTRTQILSVGIIKNTDKKTTLRTHIPFALMLLAATLIILGLADPHIPLKELKEGVNVVIVIDDSGSMAATDYTPTRLEAAKSAAEILIRSLNEKDNVGIVIFESGATTAAYLTPYKEKAIERLHAIEQKRGQNSHRRRPVARSRHGIIHTQQKRVIVLLSDGVNNAGVISPDEAIRYAKTNNIQVHTVAMGSDKQVVLGYDFFGNPQYAEPAD